MKHIVVILMIIIERLLTHLPIESQICKFGQDKWTMSSYKWGENYPGWTNESVLIDIIN